MSQTLQMLNEDNRPKWLLELENRKRKPRLAHEVGAGAPCLKCDTVCPGLDLHFWRKICKNCKCSRDDHMISDDEFPQFDLLLGASGRSKRACVVLKMNEQQIDSEDTFEWAPPNTTRELAADYMKALPEGKLPIIGSAGAALRKQQLQKQLPLHDIQYELCDEISESEKKQFKKYLENLKKYVGQGKVSKIFSARPFDSSLITPVNASECLTPKHNSRSFTNQPSVTLRTPSSFVLKSDHSSTSLSRSRELLNAERKNASIIDPIATSCKPDNIYIFDSVKSVRNTIDTPRYRHVLDIVKNDNANMVQSMNIHGNTQYNNTNSVSSHKSINNDNQSNGGIDIGGDRKDVEQDEIKDKNIEYGKIIEISRLNLLDQQEQESAIQTIDRYSETSLKRIESDSHCGNSSHFNNSPFLSKPHNPGDIARALSMIGGELEIISPPSEQFEEPTVKLSHDFLKSTFPDNRKLIDALPLHSIFHNTNVIGSSLNGTELSNIREKLMMKYKPKDKSSMYAIHPGCNIEPKTQDLICCKEQDDCYVSSNNLFNSDGNSTMMPMHMISYKNPDSTVARSEKLNNSIFPDSIAGTSNMHIDNSGLTKNNLLFNQYKENRVRMCYECTEQINDGDVVVTAEKAVDAAWHPGCFVCCTCKELLVDLVYFYYKEKLYCARDLAQLMGIPRCFACDELIFVREYTVAEGHNYHVKHFCCWDCDIPLAGKQYISENDRPLCLHCYQKTYAKLCCACNKLIAANQQGVAVKNLDFHATDQCFCCFNCNKTLLNSRMAVKENKLFCTKECIAMYLNGIISSC